MRSLILALALLAPIAASPAHAYGKHARMVGIHACRITCNEDCYGSWQSIRCSDAAARRAAKVCKMACPDLFTVCAYAYDPFTCAEFFRYEERYPEEWCQQELVDAGCPVPPTTTTTTIPTTTTTTLPARVASGVCAFKRTACTSDADCGIAGLCAPEGDCRHACSAGLSRLNFLLQRGERGQHLRRLRG
jgi:hypothetical protein